MILSDVSKAEQIILNRRRSRRKKNSSIEIQYKIYLCTQRDRHRKKTQPKQKIHTVSARAFNWQFK